MHFINNILEIHTKNVLLISVQIMFIDIFTYLVKKNGICLVIFNYWLTLGCPGTGRVRNMFIHKFSTCCTHCRVSMLRETWTSATALFNPNRAADKLVWMWTSQCVWNVSSRGKWYGRSSCAMIGWYQFKCRVTRLGLLCSHSSRAVFIVMFKRGCVGRQGIRCQLRLWWFDLEVKIELFGVAS